jgi:CheY-like chemotaxis protein
MEIQKLLILDDDQLGNSLVSTLIEDIDEIKSVYTEENGWEALNFLADCSREEEFPELILLDLKMPELDGFQFLDLYEKQYLRKYPDTKVVILTNSTLDTDYEKAKKFQSVVQYLHKPLSPDKINGLLQDLSVNGY